MAIWVPPNTSRELRDARERREAAVREAVMGPRRVEWVREFDAQLDRIVPGMMLVPCPDPAPLDVVAAGFMPGCWHVTWPGYNDGPLGVLPLVDDEDRPREPGSWVFDMLARGDMWNERSNRERSRLKREAEEARARRLERERADRDQEVLERYQAANRAFVSMDRSTPWSQNVSGARGRKKA